jgi:hypothetical protein
MGHHSGWEKIPNLQSTYRPVLRRIQFLAVNGLMSMMLPFDFLSKCITPHQLCTHPARMYIGENDAT